MSSQASLQEEFNQNIYQPQSNSIEYLSENTS